jgi:hypothetical protein
MQQVGKGVRLIEQTPSFDLGVAMHVVGKGRHVGGFMNRS